MENEMKVEVFKNEQFGEIRVLEKGGEPWFVGKDVAEMLGYSNSRDALKKHIDEEDKGVAKCDTLRGRQILTIINESGLYSLILSSKLAEAKKFKRWVTNEVLPTIRRHGAYLTDDKIEEILSNPDTIIKLATELKEKREKIKQLETEVVHKEDVIIGLVEDISLAEKRQRINQIVRYKVEPKNFSKRWNLLYDEFEKKYHLDLKRRINNCDIKPKIRNKIDYIDREMSMIPQLYEITCKLFENDVEELKNEWISVIEEKVC
ncbi:Bro-N domain-containing protein [Clostridioides difficile]|uniref:BRO-N domain-containing protein n=1 Tax=Clostridioides difficile TaxID=1496 RepID=UPI00016C5BE0|nr:Bro-N domain-containing protein [Clostridioides difficile]MCA5958298.1 Bro-N domain-containing protein [Clostridioides difficile]MCG7687473.1 Bro-N domain-containing protein [Clostridioides difficile]MCP8431236.1 Bro-N domain-containing protein [Clostridioides difficile]MCR1707653.1 Bro-N domain-containing protein [Clostridioides difficile]MCW0527579.1 Bro-N domain-containing protein [Clostridioides difficile]